MWKEIDGRDSGAKKFTLQKFELYLQSNRGGEKKLKSARSHKQQVEKILNHLESEANTFDHLFDLERLEDKWIPHAKSAKGKEGKGHKAGTIRSYLGSQVLFMEYIIEERNNTDLYPFLVIFPMQK